MTEYTASNGYRIGGWDKVARLEVHNTGHVLVHELGKYTVDALREYFQAERDNELGRWRWPENPDYVVYPRTSDPSRIARGVTVLGELIPRPYTVWEDSADTPHGASVDEESRKLARAAARAYFDAHPEPKPWQDAKHGEVWALKFGDQPEDSWFVNKDYFQNTRTLTCILLSDKAITAGRRIFPEATE